MNKTIILLMVIVCILINLSMSFRLPDHHYKHRLSEYGYFKDELKDQQPEDGVYPYEVNSPLFSDYAHKLRFIKIAPGTSVGYNPDSVLQFPVGTSIIKTFYYLNDERNLTKGRRLVETRVLIHEPDGWKSLPYIWNEEQTDAFLEVAGGTTPVSFKNEDGEKKNFIYTIPNVNQCKSCHERNGQLTPIGPSVRQLNGDVTVEGVKKNQLVYWSESGILKNLPEQKNEIPKLPSYADLSVDLDKRARAYLDINCAHCHNKAGQAQTSGLFLDWNTSDKTAYGFYKTPIAAGRGSGDLKFDIAPGQPDESILLHRMKSRDSGVMMPELGRALVHAEGVELISEWIKGMKK